MPKKKQQQQISQEKLKELQAELKAMNMQWVGLLITKIKNDKTLDAAYRKINSKKIYNVFNGIIKNGAWKVLVYKHGVLLRDELQKELDAVA